MVSVLESPPAVPVEVESETFGEMVRVADMFHDLAYSRGVGEREVQKMGSTFDMKFVGVLYVSLRADGRYAVLDGCHRHAAAAAAGIEFLPCRVYIDLDLAAEANLFAVFNRDRRQMKVGEIFRARLTAHDPRALEIVRIVRAAGMELSLNGASDPGKIQAIAATEWIYAVHGPTGLRETLAITVEAWGAKETRGYTSTALRGIAAFWVRYRERVNRARLIDRLKLAGPTQLLAKSNAYKTITLGISPDQAFGRTVLGVYNTGLKDSSRLPEWATRAYGDITKAERSDIVRRGNLARKANRAAA